MLIDGMLFSFMVLGSLDPKLLNIMIDSCINNNDNRRMSNPYFIIMDNSREFGHSNAIVHCAANDTEDDGE